VAFAALLGGVLLRFVADPRAICAMAPSTVGAVAAFATSSTAEANADSADAIPAASPDLNAAARDSATILAAAPRLSVHMADVRTVTMYVCDCGSSTVAIPSSSNIRSWHT